MAHVITLADSVYEMLKNHCLNVEKDMTVDELLMEMMDYPEIPIHFPYHHFIMPAALLTLAAREDNIPKDELEAMLDDAIARAKNVLGGFCGEYGACGAGVGTGIFMSVYTGTDALSEESWSWTINTTSKALQCIATCDGPRCCKRTAFLAVKGAIPYINEKLDLNLKLNENIICKYYEKNEECLKENCPYYEKKDK